MLYTFMIYNHPWHNIYIYIYIYKYTGIILNPSSSSFLLSLLHFPLIPLSSSLKKKENSVFY